jgi:hypothetical protein
MSLKTLESKMNIIRVVKSQAVILYARLLKILVFSGIVEYLEGGFFCEEGMSPFLEKINCFNSFKT